MAGLKDLGGAGEPEISATAKDIASRRTIPFLGPGMSATGHFDATGGSVVDSWTGDLPISATAKQFPEEDGSVPEEELPARCEVYVPNGSLHRCGKAAGHQYAHQVTVKDTTYSWGWTGRWNEPGVVR